MKRFITLLAVLLATTASAAPVNIKFMTLNGVQQTGSPSTTISPKFDQVGIGNVVLQDNGSGGLDMGGTPNYVQINAPDGSSSEEQYLAVSRGGTNSGTALFNNRVMKSSGGAIVEAAAISGNSALASDSNGIPVASATTATQLGYLSTITSDVQVQIDSRVADTGDTMTGSLTMTGGATVTGIPSPVSADDATPKNYVDALVNGTTWVNPIDDPNLVDDSLNTPPGSPVVGSLYIVGASPTGAWVSIGAGHATWWDGAVWQDLLGRAVAIGDRFGVTFSQGTAAGGLTGDHNDIVTVTDATPGAVTYTVTTPIDTHATFVDMTNSYWFGLSYVYILSSTSWVEFSGPSATPLANPLYYTGNTINLRIDNSTLDLFSGTTLEVKNGGITDTQVNASAAIAFSKLAALPSTDILVGSGGNVATAVPLSGDASLSNLGALTVNTVGASSAANIHTAELLANAATSANTASAIVRRDVSGNIVISQLTASAITGLSTPLSAAQGGTGVSGTAVFPSSGNVLTDVNSFAVTNKTLSVLSNTVTNIVTEFDFTGDGVTTDFTLTSFNLIANNSTLVYNDGRLQKTGGGNAYTRTNANPGHIIFTVAPDTNSWVHVVVVNQQ